MIKAFNKSILTIFMCMMLALTGVMLAACGEDDSTPDAPPTTPSMIEQWGFASGLYADNLEEDGNGGIIFNRLTNFTPNTSAATYFGEADHNLEWDGEGTYTFTFTLDLSVMEEDDYTTWIISFNKSVGGVFTHAEEARVGIIKTSTGYMMNEIPGNASGSNADELNKQAILNSSLYGEAKSFEAENDIVEVTFEFNYENSDLTYTISVNDASTTATTKMVENLAGFKYLWNCATTFDGAVFSNFEFGVVAD